MLARVLPRRLALVFVEVVTVEVQAVVVKVYSVMRVLMPSLRGLKEPRHRDQA